MKKMKVEEIQLFRAANIHKLIKEGDFTKKSFAEKAEMNYSSFVNKLNGRRNCVITAGNARKIEKNLDVSFGSLDLDPDAQNLPAVTEKNTTEVLLMTDNISIRATLDLNNSIDVKIRKLIGDIMNLREK